MVVGTMEGSCLLVGVYNSGMLVVTGEEVGRKVAKKGVLRLLSSRQSRVDFRAVRGSALLSEYEDDEFGRREVD